MHSTLVITFLCAFVLAGCANTNSLDIDPTQQISVCESPELPDLSGLVTAIESQRPDSKEQTHELRPGEPVPLVIVGGNAIGQKVFGKAKFVLHSLSIKGVKLEPVQAGLCRLAMNDSRELIAQYDSTTRCAKVSTGLGPPLDQTYYSIHEMKWDRGCGSD